MFASMKRLVAYLLLPVMAMVLMTACGDEPKDTEFDQPIFNEPSLKKVSLEIQKNPEDASLYYERGMILAGRGVDTLAIKDFKKAASLDSSKSEYFSAVGDLMFEHKDIDGSIPWIEHALSLNPRDPRARLKLAKLYLYIGEHNKVFREANIVLRQDVYNAEAYYLKGMTYKDIDSPDKAISSFSTAVQVDPKYRDAVIQLGLMYSEKEDPIALQYYDNAYKMDTTDVFPLYAKGVYYQDLKQYENAKKEYKNVIIQDRMYANAYYNIGYILLQQDSFAKAYSHYDILTKLYPADAEAYYNRGLANELMKKIPEAVTDYKQALIFDENYQDAKDALSRIGG